MNDPERSFAILFGALAGMITFALVGWYSLLLPVTVAVMEAAVFAHGRWERRGA